MLSLSVFVLLSVFWSALCQCPAQETIAPACTCRDMGSGPMVLCTNLMSVEELIPIIKSTDSRNMFALTIADSSLLYIPSTLFKNTKYQKIQFTNTQIMALSDSDLAFEGLEDRLEEIRAKDAHYITTWEWSQLRNLRKLDLLDINLISFNSLDQEFPALTSLSSLGISRADISFIHPTAFSKLVNLKILNLEYNLITELTRSMLPNPAEQLMILDLSNNEISILPDDMFEGMPNLMQLELNNNKLTTLREEIFSWPMQNVQTLFLKGNEFRCDCRLRWMVGVDKPMYFEGNCSLPETLKDLPLKYLSHKVLWC